MTGEPIPLAGVIGAPVSHSRSPALHGYWLRKYRLKGYYIPIELGYDTFEQGLRSLPLLGFHGVNITIPFKEKVLTLADVITDRAALIGAANTITFLKDGRIQADNTDGFGFIANIRQQAPDWDATVGPAMVLGAGGAARAIVSALLAEGAPSVRISNRTRNRADMLKEHFGGRVSVIEWSNAASEMQHAATLVNATSLGMTGQPELTLNLDRLRPSTLVAEIVYSPLNTGLLQKAAERGCRTVDGLGMLLHQAVPGFENWFRVRPEVDIGLRQVVLNA
ncbi:MAG: shikimate dehydrogenase [Rhodobacteraceae bacterium]|nr:shikimate dehydrogenase [Paracoccaceae bacterium]